MPNHWLAAGIAVVPFDFVRDHRQNTFDRCPLSAERDQQNCRPACNTVGPNQQAKIGYCSSALDHSARHSDIWFQYQLFHLAYARILLICILDELTAIVWL